MRSGSSSKMSVACWAVLTLTGCGQSEAPDDELQPVRATQTPRIASAHEALSGAHITALDPATMNNAEITKVIGDGPRCEFRYAMSGRPVLALSRSVDQPRSGVVKLNGVLVELKPSSVYSYGWQLSVAGPIRTNLEAPDLGNPTGLNRGKQTVMDLVFEIESELKVGYRGYYNCVGGGSKSP